ncbi:hypothetical protein FRB90_010356 [Tulasnella sp. 427]|nr:hypothetical protein FRB90_010356 [Tulasnella sp. 427]
MAVFSRIVVLAACLVSSALFVNANTEDVNVDGQVTARHLKHSQPRAHHAHVAHSHKHKRGDEKKRACAAKGDNEVVKNVHHTTTTTKHHTTTTTKASTSTHKAVSYSSSGGKAGLCWNDGNQPWIKAFEKTGKVTWYYTWSPWDVGNTNLEHVPMLWSSKQIGPWNKLVAGKTFKNVLAFNE